MYQKKRGRQLIAAGVIIVVLVLGVGLVLPRLTGGANGKPGQAEAMQLAPEVVALQPIPAGTTFVAGEPLAQYFGVKQVPRDAIPFGAYSNVSQIDSLIRSTGCVPQKLVNCQGKVTTTQTIFQDLPIVTGMFSTLGQFRQAPSPAFTIPYGYVGIAVSFSSANSVLGSIEPGDDIDLIASYTGNEQHTNSVTPTQTQYVLNDVRVIAVNGPAAPPSQSSSTSAKNAATQDNSQGGSLLLLVRYQQALIIQHLKDFGNTWAMSCVLRSAKETDIPHFRTLPVTMRWFFVKQDNHFDWTNPY